MQITAEKYRSNTPYAPDRVRITARDASGAVSVIDVSLPHLREALEKGESDDGGHAWFAKQKVG